MKSRWIVLLAICGFALATAGVIFSKKLTVFGGSEIDKTLSSIEKLKDMQENQVYDYDIPKLNEESRSKLSSFKGKVILLNFWASWCQPCILEFPDMIKLAEEVPDMEILAVSRDMNKADALNFIDSFPESKGKISFFWDPKGEMTSLFGTEVLPESYLIGKDFKVLKKVVGIEDWDHPNVIKFIKGL